MTVVPGDGTLVRSARTVWDEIKSNPSRATELIQMSNLMREIRSQINARSWTTTKAVRNLGPVAEHIMRNDFSKVTLDQLRTIRKMLLGEPKGHSLDTVYYDEGIN